MKPKTELTWKDGEYDIKYTDGTVSHEYGLLSSCGTFFIHDTKELRNTRYCVTFTPNSRPVFYVSNVCKAKEIVSILVEQDFWDARLFSMDREMITGNDTNLFRIKILACRQFLRENDAWQRLGGRTISAMSPDLQKD